MEDRQTGTAGPEVFSHEQAMIGVDNDVELLRELIAIFCEDCPRMVTELGDSIRSGEGDRIMRAAHTLKGSLAVLGAPASTALAAELESMGHHDDLVGAQELFDRLVQEVERLDAVLAGV